MKEDIVKSNALIEAAYNPGNVYQMRLLLAALMQVKSGDKLDFRKNYVITANALADMTGSKAKNNYTELRNAAKELGKQVITIYEKPNGQVGKPDEIDISITSSCRYYKNEGKVSLRFTEEITPYISDLKKRFTKYQAKYVMPMRSSYGIRLYELCLQWLGDEREFEVNDFRLMFGLEKKYSNVSELKRNVIDRALNDINNYSDIRVKFGQRKSGRKVTHFQFIITRPVKHKEITQIPKPSFDDYVSQHARTGESWEQAKKRLTEEYRAL